MPKTRFSGKSKIKSAGKSPRSKKSVKGSAKQRVARAANFKAGSLGGGGTWADIPD
jgi:hypothetical protein